MFGKKPKRNFRRRKGDSSGEDEPSQEEQGEATDEVKVSVAPRLLKYPQSRGISCTSKRESGSSRPDSVAGQNPHTENVSEDTAAEDAAEKKLTKNKITLLSFGDEKQVDEDDFKVKKPVAKAVVFKARTKEINPPAFNSQGPKGPVSQSDCGDDKPEGEKIQDGSNDDTSSQKSSSSSSSVSDPGDIPDALQIEAARRQRKLARARQDYIPLATRHGSSPVLKDEEEEDSDDEPDDHQRRIPFAPKPKTLRQRIAEKMSESGSEDERSNSQDEDQNLWVEQQIGKGVKRPQNPDGEISREPVKDVKVKLDFPVSLPVVNFDIIKKRLTGKLDSLREVHRAHEQEQKRIQMDIESAKTSVEQLEGASTDQRYKFYKEMKIYVQNLVDCLTEKVLLINEVESEMHFLLKEQAESLLNHRREKIREESSHIHNLTYETDSSSTESNNNIGDGKGCSVEEKKNSTEGDVGSRSRESHGTEGVHCDRLSSDDETPAETQPEFEAHFAKRKDDILDRHQKIFDDVQENFCDVKKILSKFDEWRRRFPDSYYSAYIGLCLPKLLGPLVRHQLIGWNPLKDDGKDFEAFPWYSAVETFCHGHGYEESEAADIKTLPSIIEKTVLPKIQGFVEQVWDPLSSKQTKCLVKHCEELQDGYSVFNSEQSKTKKAFVNAVVLRMRSSVDEDVFIPIYPKKYVDDRCSPQRRFQDKQFWSAVRLLGNIMLWDGLVPEDTIKELSLDRVLNRYIMITLMNTLPDAENVEKCKKVAACFPRSWFEDAEAKSSISQLKNFSNHLLQIVHSLCKSNPGDDKIRDIVVNILILLRSINALDHVAAIIEQYRYEDLKTSLNIH
ncbi:intron Large complex component GCFC2 isoform X1 [Lepisosteus oculatus]|uniref:intron Large complex component GCFC2 isoform X1 n=1 Tax=Lepisosteus oculatus TaxID=7918 RepID=UPI0035F50221